MAPPETSLRFSRRSFKVGRGCPRAAVTGALSRHVVRGIFCATHIYRALKISYMGVMLAAVGSSDFPKARKVARSSSRAAQSLSRPRLQGGAGISCAALTLAFPCVRTRSGDTPCIHGVSRECSTEVHANHN